MRSRRSLAPVLTLAAALAAAGCSDVVSYVVLTLKTPDTVPPSPPSPPITGVTSVVVKVSKDGHPMRTLTYPAEKLDGSIDMSTRATLAVSFDGDLSGTATFEIEAVDDRQGCIVGRSGSVTIEIKKAAVVSETVVLQAAHVCGADGGVDGGGGDAPDRIDALPGCDPANPTSTATGLACASTQTCQVNCDNPARNECIEAGTGGPGAVCETTSGCQPGTQCFDYAGLHCPVKVCLKFCNSNADCAAFGAGGAGPGSVCEGIVQCGGTQLGYHTCTFNCDPRAVAAAGRGGCPVGLACIAPETMDRVDCGCAVMRIKTEGMPCTGGSECAAGLLCNEMGGTKVCRAICRCDKNPGNPDSCTAPNDCPTSGTICRPVVNNTSYGICL